MAAETTNLKYRYELAAAAYLKDQKAVGVSEKTANNYQRRIGYFADFLSEKYPDTDPEGGMIEPSDIRDFRDKLLGRGLKPSTVKQYLVELEAFFSACLDSDMGYARICTRNPVSKRFYPMLKADDKTVKGGLLEEDYKKLWANIPAENRKECWARDYAIVMILLDGKIRNEELLNLRLSDVDFEYGEICIRSGKGRKMRFVTVHDITVAAIRLYLLSGMRPERLTEDDLLFGTQAQKGVSFASGGNTRHSAAWHIGTSQWLSQLVERHVRAVTGREGFRTHALRHAGAALDLNNQVSMERIQAELGHSSIVTTQIYTETLKSIRRSSRSKEITDERDRWGKLNMEMVEKITAAKETAEKTA